MITRRIGATSLLLLLASLAVGFVLAGPVGATEPGPAYPPAPGADDVVHAGEGTGAGGDGGTSGGDGGSSGGNEGTAPAGAADDGGSAGSDPASGSDGAGGADASTGDEVDDDAEVIDPSTADRPDDAVDPADDEVVADGDDAADRAAPGGGRGVGPILVVVGTAVLLGGGVVAIARRL